MAYNANKSPQPFQSSGCKQVQSPTPSMSTSPLPMAPRTSTSTPGPTAPPKRWLPSRGNNNSSPQSSPCPSPARLRPHSIAFSDSSNGGLAMHQLAQGEYHCPVGSDCTHDTSVVMFSSNASMPSPDGWIDHGCSSKSRQESLSVPHSVFVLCSSLLPTSFFWPFLSSFLPFFLSFLPVRFSSATFCLAPSAKSCHAN